LLLLAGLVLGGCVRETRQATEPDVAISLPELVLEPIDEGLPRNGLWVGTLSVLPHGLSGDDPPALLSAPARKSGKGPVLYSLKQGHAWRQISCEFPPRPYDYGPTLAGDLTGDGALEIVLGAHLRGLAVLESAHGDSGCRWTDIDRGLPTGIRSAPPVSVGALALTPDAGGPPWLWVLPDIPSGRTDIRGLRAFRYEDDHWKTIALNEAIGSKTGAGLATGRWIGEQWLIVASRIINDRSVLMTQTMSEWSFAPIKGWPVFDRLFHDAVGTRRLENGRQAPLLSYRYAHDKQWFRRLVQLNRDDDGNWQQQILSETATRTPFTALAGANLPGADSGEDIIAATKDGAWHMFRQLFRQSATGFEQRVEPAPAWRRGCQARSIEAVDIVGDLHDELIVNYATDPPAYDFTRPCPSNGGIEAWRIRPPFASMDASSKK